MLEIGDRVSFINENLDGKVISIKGDKLIVEDQDGFPIECSLNEVVKIGDFDRELSNYIDSGSMRRILSEKEMNKPHKSVKRKAYNPDEFYIQDLHIQNLLPNYQHLDSGDILEYQLNRARKKLEECMSKNLGGVIFIHGHGNGVLKYELKRLLGEYKVDYRDADYAKFGGGAMEVTIF
jgi:dsDNA-specific endonuclease/ATPase MutS2